MSKHLVVIGGGAAGFFCAVNAARMDPALKVTIIEKSHRLLSKVKISGGGRCNVTHACFDITDMSKQYPRGNHFVKKTFHQFFTTDTIKWFSDRGVELKTEPDGRMFPVSDSSQTIIDCLMKEANKSGIGIMMRSEVLGIDHANEKFQLSISGDRHIIADLVCVACGGYPKSSMFEWLKKTGHTIEDPVPSLFTFNLPKHPIAELMGVSVEKARVRIPEAKLVEEGPLLITHWGLSGPVILRSSAWGAKELSARHYEFSVTINWLCQQDYNEPRVRAFLLNARDQYASQKISAYNFAGLPQRLWQFLISISGVTKEMRFADLPKKTENVLVKNLVDHAFSVQGKTTFKEEFVTAGGIRLNEIDANTMMSKKVPGLFFAGEVMDVDGITGGYNFQHAWTSGWIAAKGIVGEIKK